MNRVYIHIGLPKTATSSIQRFLYDNNDVLSQYGYHYLKTGLSDALKCHHDLVWKLGLHKGPSYVQEDIERYSQETLESLRIEVENNPGKDLIISSELFTFIGDFKRLKPLLDIFQAKEVKFILNLRRQDKFLESLYQQVVKDGIDTPFSEWLKKSRGIANYNVLVTKLLDIVSKENIIINLFDTRIPNFHPVESFLYSLGVEEKKIYELKIENIKENESLSHEQIEKIRESNMLDPQLRFDLIRQFLEERDDESFEKASYFDKDSRNKIVESFHSSNAKLIRNMNIPPDIARLLL